MDIASDLQSVVSILTRHSQLPEDMEARVRSMTRDELARRRHELSYAFYWLHKGHKYLDPFLLKKRLWKEFQLIDLILEGDKASPLPPYFQERMVEADAKQAAKLFAELRRMNAP